MRPRLGFLFAHAWLSLDGRAIDITWRDLAGGDNLDCVYLGVEFLTPAVASIVEARGYYGLLDPVDALVLDHFKMPEAA